MKRRVLAVIMAAAMVMSMTACGGKKTETTAAPAKTEAAADKGDTATKTESGAWKEGDTVYVDVPAKAGGGTDLYTRYLTQALTEVCPGVNFVVTNYDTGEVGMEHVKNSKPDGLTLGTCHGGAIIQYLCGSSEVSLKDDMKIMGIMNQGGPQAIIAKKDAPYKNFNEFAEYVKAHPGEVIVGCSLGGTTQILFTSLIEGLVGDASLVNFVQCSSEADKLTNVASGAIDIANCSIPNALSYDADGKLTVLGTLGPKVATLDNMSELIGEKLDPKFATTLEQGVETTWDSCYYVIASKDTPDEIAKAINEALMKASETQSFIDGNNKMATYIGAIDYETAQKTFEAEWTKLDELVTGMGLKVER